MSRANDRKEFDQGTRVTLLEGDADKFEGAVEGLQASMDSVTSWLIKAAVGFATSALVLALNVIFGYIRNGS